MKKSSYKGLIAASFTPFKKNGEVDLKKIPSLVDFAVGNHLSALFVCGSTGEFASMTTRERIDVAQSFLEAAAGKLPVIVHVGSCSTQESIQLAEHAEAHGASGIAALAPFYFQVKTVKTLTQCLGEIAGAASDLPFYYYHLPSATGANININDFLPVAEKVIPNLAGIKFTHENLMDYQRSVEYAADRMQILFGRDEILLSALALGGKAAVGSTFNYVSWIYYNVISAFEAGNMEEAQRWQSLSQRAVSLLERFGFGAHKAFMTIAGADAGYSRLPLGGLDKSEFNEFKPLAEEIFQFRS